MIILMTPEKKKIHVNMNSDVCLYSSPRNPPNTGTKFTSGTDLFAHKARSGRWYFYYYLWSMWEGMSDEFDLIDEPEAREFIIGQLGIDSWSRAGVQNDECERLLPGIFKETA